MLNIFSIVFRESLEAVLIVSLIIATLAKQGILEKCRQHLIIGIVAGIFFSFALASGLYYLDNWLEGNGLVYFEALLFILSALLMVHMVFWMRTMVRSMSINFSQDIIKFQAKWGFLAVAIVSCLAIAREGAELVIYLYSMSLNPLLPITSLSIPALLALVCALATGYLIIQGTKRINLSLFFNITSFFLLVTAGAFMIQASYRLIELELIPTLINPIWDTSHLIPIESSFGSFLHFFMGYTTRPPLTTVVIYSVFWLSVLFLFKISQGRLIPQHEK